MLTQILSRNANRLHEILGGGETILKKIQSVRMLRKRPETDTELRLTGDFVLEIKKLHCLTLQLPLPPFHTNGHLEFGKVLHTFCHHFRNQSNYQSSADNVCDSFVFKLVAQISEHPVYPGISMIVIDLLVATPTHRPAGTISEVGGWSYWYRITPVMSSCQVARRGLFAWRGHGEGSR
jgi:hypothetical protein